MTLRDYLKIPLLHLTKNNNMQVTVSGHEPVNITDSADGLLFNDTPFDWDMVEVSERSFHVIFGNKSYEMEVVKADYESKSFTIKINGKLAEVNAKDRFDLLLEEMGMSDLAAQKVNDLKAPMPGLILDILVQPGDEISKGDKLLILEAMKMENILKAPADAVVKEVKIEKGQNVEKNQLLLLFE